jgi:hypothetical protein
MGVMFNISSNQSPLQTSLATHAGGFVQHGLSAAGRIRLLGQDRAAADKR